MRCSTKCALLRRSGAASNSVGASDGPVPTGTQRAPSTRHRPRKAMDAAAIHLWLRILGPHLGGPSSSAAIHVLPPSGHRRRRGPRTAPRNCGLRPPTHSSTTSSKVTSNETLRMAADCRQTCVRVAVLRSQSDVAPHTCELKGSTFAAAKHGENWSESSRFCRGERVAATSQLEATPGCLPPTDAVR